MTEPRPTIRATRYEVSCLPVGHPERAVFTITVEMEDSGRWSITHADHYPDGKIITQRLGSDLSEERAVELAKKFAATMTFVGHSPADILAMTWLVGPERDRTGEGPSAQ